MYTASIDGETVKILASNPQIAELKTNVLTRQAC